MKSAAADSVAAAASRLDALECQVKQVAGALKKIGVIEETLDRLVTREIDEIKHAPRGHATAHSKPGGRPERATRLGRLSARQANTRRAVHVPGLGRALLVRGLAQPSATAKPTAAMLKGAAHVNARTPSLSR